ncbi:hypothetical protein [Novosphingobium sp.]|uniref:hypothetical protein n=1 Tax=Novosphingobium sp. TaxID=1874826 RepID=UPI00260FEF64|nr:hypothetical protein [Novosphingobium sp.]
MGNMDLPTTIKGRGAAAAEQSRRSASTMDCLSRMETLARRLDLGSRKIGDALMEAAESPTLADSATVKDALELSTMLDEQICELSELVQRAAGTLRAASVRRPREREGAIDPAAHYLAAREAFNAGLIGEAEYVAAWRAMAEWKPTSTDGFTRKVLAMFGDDALPERPWVDSLIADGARLVEAG